MKSSSEEKVDDEKFKPENHDPLTNDPLATVAEQEHENAAVSKLRVAFEEASIPLERQVDSTGHDADSISGQTESDSQVDDALTEGFMGMECTLERGFSPNETSLRKDMREERYRDIAFSYHRNKHVSRYYPTLRHLLPVRYDAKVKDEMPSDSAGLYSFLSYSWIGSLVWKAYKDGLRDDDIPLCSKYDMCGVNSERLEFMWKKEVDSHGIANASLLRVVWIFARTRLLLSISVFVLALSLGFIGPAVFLRHLIDWMTTDEPLTVGLVWMAGLVLSEFCRVVLFGLFWRINYTTAVRLRAASLGLIYKKFLRMSDAGSKSVGEVINMFANDGQRIFDAITLGPLVIGGPIIAIAAMVYILLILGPWALLGTLIFLIFYPFEYGISQLAGYFRHKTVSKTDERVRQMSEILTCIKLIKMYAWERSFTDNITDIRSRERSLLEKSAYINSVNLAMAPTMPVVAALFTFLAHIGAGYNLTAAQAMSVVSLLLLYIRMSLNLVSYSVQALAEYGVSHRRLQRVLAMNELDNYVEVPVNPKVAVEFRYANLAWKTHAGGECMKKPAYGKRKVDEKASEPSEEKPLSAAFHREPSFNELLYDIDMSVHHGELVGICGAVGVGKSSLLSALLGHMKLVKGSVAVSGPCAYVGQQAWILNATLRENILLGEAFDAKRYYNAIYACSLTADILSLTAGDSTEIGERGVTLSGGQKQRLSLARALYSNKSIYLLDDPLSAVDYQIGSHIFQHALKKFLKGKSTLFVTHQLQYLPFCDRVIFLNDGRIQEQGTHLELMHCGEGYASLYRKHMETVGLDSQADPVEEHKPQRYRTESVTSTDSLVSRRSSQPHTETSQDFMQTGLLMTAEEKEEGDIPLSVYRDYIKFAGGYILSILVVSVFAVNIGSVAFSSWWLSYWISAGSGNSTYSTENRTAANEDITENPDLEFYQLIYVLTVILILVTSLIRGFVFMKVTLKASSHMHNKLFSAILKCPMSYFDTTPVGRIINLFSRDVDECDVRVPRSAEVLLQNIWIILLSLFFVCLVFPYLLFLVLILSALLFYLKRIYRVGIQDLKRFENISRSPLYSHVSTTISGLSAISAYQKQDMFLQRFMLLFDDNSAHMFLFHNSMRWLALQLDILALLVLLLTAMFAVFLKGTVGAAYTGLALAYASQLGGLFQYTVRLSMETEAGFTSVQRLIRHIKSLPCEPPSLIENTRPPPDWPCYGRITFHKVKMRYRHDIPLVLKGVSFFIDRNEKIGVVGRTGSGKSSLAVALFRLVDLSGGYIKIDGIDISTIGLEVLRSHLSVIPQDPVFFAGTVRSNLDPFNSHTDEELWEALEKTYMKEYIVLLPLNLLSPVAENGENFSVGERQLLCMARALLRNSKILFLDEATAAIDTETDSKIQKTLEEAFTDCTMITVAHRLNTVMSYSRILVIDDGKVAEFDTPAALLSRPSLFAKMLEAAEKSTSAL